jgi:proteasome lid subunit RPN8/RPN11
VSQKSKSANEQPALAVDCEVVRKIRQHARSSSKTEICGVLIGCDLPGRIEVQACIPGANAEEAGAHVTFTQDTWEHIYQIKDKEFPDHRIVGWYHSHPGFGVFLSDHDTFIHENFFASPGQVAWVFDPHSDEEGCFGWVNSRIERLSRIVIIDQRGGESAQKVGQPEDSFSSKYVPETQEIFEDTTQASTLGEDNSSDSLLRLTTTVFSYLAVLLVGFLLAWFLFPRIAVVTIPVDPQTGRPLPGYTMEGIPGGSAQNGLEQPTNPRRGMADTPAKPDTGSKEKNVQPQK